MIIIHHPDIGRIFDIAVPSKIVNRDHTVGYFLSATPEDTAYARIFKSLKKVIMKTLDIEGAKIIAKASFEDDLGMDSLDQVELMMEIETTFLITVPDDDVCKLKTVNDAVLYIKNKEKKQHK